MPSGRRVVVWWSQRGSSKRARTSRPRRSEGSGSSSAHRGLDLRDRDAVAGEPGEALDRILELDGLVTDVVADAEVPARAGRARAQRRRERALEERDGLRRRLDRAEGLGLEAEHDAHAGRLGEARQTVAHPRDVARRPRVEAGVVAEGTERPRRRRQRERGARGREVGEHLRERDRVVDALLVRPRRPVDRGLDPAQVVEVAGDEGVAGEGEQVLRLEQVAQEPASVLVLAQLEHGVGVESDGDPHRALDAEPIAQRDHRRGDRGLERLDGTARMDVHPVGEPEVVAGGGREPHGRREPTRGPEAGSIRTGTRGRRGSRCRPSSAG